MEYEDKYTMILIFKSKTYPPYLNWGCRVSTRASKSWGQVFVPMAIGVLHIDPLVVLDLKKFTQNRHF